MKLAESNKSEYMVKTCFKHLNQYKRLRALEEIESERKNHEQQVKFELSRYKAIDQLELSLRALQGEIRKETE